MKTINNYRGNVKSSLKQLVSTGKTYTGRSGYSKGWAHKSVWTVEVVAACKELGIVIESGNDAPKGGASGEYVKLVADKRSNRNIWADIKAAKVAAEKASQDAADYKARFISFIEANKALFVKQEDMSWSQVIAKVLNQAGFINFPIGFNSIKSILFTN